MKRNLALGLFFAAACLANLAITRAMRAEEVGNCADKDCVKSSTCIYEYTCMACIYVEGAGGFCIRYY